MGWQFHDADYGYTEFMASVDAVVMGRKTWEQAKTFEAVPFARKQVFVLSRTLPPARSASIPEAGPFPRASGRAAGFDVDAALAQRPDLLLVHELAHANAAESRHAKRCQDVRVVEQIWAAAAAHALARGA